MWSSVRDPHNALLNCVVLLCIVILADFIIIIIIIIIIKGMGLLAC
jgi:hypothetical protein